MVDPSLLERLGRNHRVVLISGTNGKTTTTRLLATAASRLGKVATSAAGANMAAGLVSALIDDPSAALAVLETDEAHLPGLGAALRPELVVLLNLSRDQLDRTNEVRMLSERWRLSLPALGCRVVANADDPLVVWAAENSSDVVWVALGGAWHEDAYHCPACDARIEFSSDSGTITWSCSCGFAKPKAAFRLTEEGLQSADGTTEPIELQLPGRFNRANAAIAGVASLQLGVSLADAFASMRGVSEIAGRFAPHQVNNRPGSLLLAKNPAGWTELIDLVAPSAAPVVIGINARIADGHDPSWLWDVPFERLRDHIVVATGERRDDLAVRLLHAGVRHLIASDPIGALQDFGDGPIDFIGNYTAFQDVRKSLRAKGRDLVALAPVAAPREVVLARTAVGVEDPHSAHFSSPRESRLRIVIVHPDLLGTYGDAGNGIILANRALWRDIAVELVLAPSDVALPRGGDLYCLGGGEDGPQVRAAETLRNAGFVSAVEHGATVLAVCAGYQILGHSFPGAHGAITDGLGLLDVTTRRGERRAVGEILLEDSHGHLLTGFENHAGRTAKGDGVASFGAVRVGIGNGDGSDGARVGKVIGTYLHGPVLARNTWLGDELLELATGSTLAPLDDHEEELLASERLHATSGAHARIAQFRRGLLRRGLRELVSS
jgi:CobQ-like glutamine amidotransferase family enzyme